MLIVYNLMIGLTLFFIFNNIFFNCAIGAVVEPVVTTITEIPTDLDERIPIVELVETGYDYVIISTSVIPKDANITVKVKIGYEIEINGNWTKNKERGIKSSLSSRKTLGNRVVLNWKVSPLTEGTKYRFFMAASYDKISYPETPIEETTIETMTKLLAPITSIVERPSVIRLKGNNVKIYNIEMHKTIDDKPNTECILKIQMPPCFGNEFTIPEFAFGHNFTIETWFVNTNGLESEKSVIEVHLG